MDSSKPVRSRSFCVLSYPGSDWDSLLEKARSYEHAYILHDKDLDDSGSLKKPHYHLILSFKNAVWSSAIAKELGIDARWVQVVRNFDSMLDYLIHANEPSKFQYPLDQVFGSSKILQRLKKNLKDEISESFRVIELLEIIENADPSQLTVISFAKVCASMGVWDIFRRSASIFLHAIKERKSQEL